MKKITVLIFAALVLGACASTSAKKQDFPPDFYCKSAAAYNKGNFDEAKALLAQGCAGGINSACVRQAIIAMEQGNIAEASAIFEQTCKRGDGAACYNLALLKEDSDAKAAKKFYKKACKLKVEQACEKAK
ncbi:hypothetical protein Emin_0801 [Elusimicrobium minutum Pei191]|uniref:Beta-lactamase n=1 Tax=Elusimicrobium minutum (strain Pei191) TaxID=445932 RepID=B2KCW0_ELUMP|nr:hypothetical protein [Elusimicrobium minutum]ACC98356.1 hypothetical protein Emin_0801 [Elusimicrobium minutum Pei191]